jgi:hypothetical protein
MCLQTNTGRHHMTMATEKTVLVLDPLDQPIKGAKKIRAARGNHETLPQVFRGLENGHIPARKRGRLWETTLRLMMTGGPAPSQAIAAPALADSVQPNAAASPKGRSRTPPREPPAEPSQHATASAESV